MKTYVYENRFGKFSIAELGNERYMVRGSIAAARAAFKQIGRKPPNKYGTFYGREKAGYAACRELIQTLDPATVYVSPELPKGN